jgi:hypothetical protein
MAKRSVKNSVSKNPLCDSPKGTKFSKSLTSTNFAKDPKGSHSGHMNSFKRKGK